MFESCRRSRSLLRVGASVMPVVVLLIALFLLPGPISVKADTYLSCYSNSYDGYVTANGGATDNYPYTQGRHEDYTAQSKLSASYTSSTMAVGQNLNGTSFTIWRGILVFDTTLIPSDATITSAELTVTGAGDASTTDFTVVLVEAGDIHAPPISTDFDALLSCTDNLAQFSTVAWDPSGENTFTLGTEGIDVIKKGAYTVFGLRSKEDIDVSEPADSEYILLWTSESDYEPILTVTYTPGDLGNPDTLTLTMVNVFSNYISDNDQLYIFRPYVRYKTTPLYSVPEEYFRVQLVEDTVDGEVVVGQVPLHQWGASVLSLYLGPDDALPTGVEYDLVFDPTDKLTADNFSYTIQLTDWKGSDLSLIDAWVGTSAVWLGVMNGAGMLAYLESAGETWILNSAGAKLFVEGIPCLDRVRPDLFRIQSIPVVTPDEHDDTVQTSLWDNWGTTNKARLDAFGEAIGLNGSFVAGLFFFILAVAAYFVVHRLTNNSGAALLPVVLVAVFAAAFGGLILAALVLITVFAVLYMVYRLTVSGIG